MLTCTIWLGLFTLSFGPLHYLIEDRFPFSQEEIILTEQL